MPNLPLLLAFGFTHLPMLWWAAAAAAPIIIHLLSRRKYRETTWAAMEYLLAAMKRQTRKILLEQRLLLLLRTLLVLMVVFAVAEPYVERLGLAFAPRGRTHRVLVLDASYSMAYRPTDKTRFERAKELASQIVDESAQGDAFTLVQMSARPRTVVGTPAFEPSQIREEIDALELTHAGADLPVTIAAVEKVIENVRRETRRIDRHEVYFFTDLQRTTWAPNLSDAALAEFRRQVEELSESAGLVLIDVGQETADNLAITSLSVAEPVVTVGRRTHVQVELSNSGRQARAGQAVELLVDGRRVEQKHADVPAQGTARVPFEYRFETPGDHSLEARAPGDALDIDNHRYLIVPVRQSIRALCIDGRPASDRLGGATDYLATALVSQGNGGEHPAVETDVATESALLERDLGVYDCVFLADVAQFTSSEARALDAYLGHGGNLVFFLGAHVQADRYNRELGGGVGWTSSPSSTRILPAQIGNVVEKWQAGLDPLGYRHKIAQAFRGHDKAGLLTAPVAKYFKLSLPKDSSANVVLALGNGDPLVVEQSFRHGKVVLVATSADTSWAPMPTWPSYVPLVREILKWCVASQGQQQNLEVGEPLAASLAGLKAEPAVTVKRPDGQIRAGQLHTDGDYGQWGYDDTLLSGVYTVQFGAPVSRTQAFAVNVNTVESDLTPVDIEETEAFDGIPLVHRTSWQRPDALAVGPIARPGHLHVGLLYAVLGLLFVESFLAWRFGHHAR